MKKNRLTHNDAEQKIIKTCNRTCGCGKPQVHVDEYQSRKDAALSAFYQTITRYDTPKN